MKRKLSLQLAAAFMLLGLSSITQQSIAQEHITLSMENITSTPNTIEYDLYVVNDGTTELKLSGCAFGVNFNNQILNGSVPNENSYQMIQGSASQALSGLSAYSLNVTNNERFSQLRLTMAPAQKSNSAVLAANVPYRVGRFRFTNSSNWATNSNPSFSLNEYNVPGISTSCAIAYIGNATNYKGFSTALKNLTCKVVNSPLLNAGSGITKIDAGNENVQNQMMATANTQVTATGRQNSGQEMGTYISIYPNPTVDMLHIDFQTKKVVNTLVKVMDIHGRVAKKIQARSEKGFNTMTISLQEVPAGVYTVQVYQDNALSFTDKVTKKD
ncbi:MAG TPA: T9SS type A sorting domain-containing protein [Chitinophagaceae bacterium]|nr:T9SS type A sorting domain-containing protein [Chitinophagaceae bacterium]